MSIRKRLVIYGILTAVVINGGIILISFLPPAAKTKQCPDGYLPSTASPGDCDVEETPAVSSNAPINLAFETLVTSLKGPVASERAIIKTQAEWQAFWKRTHSHITPLPNIIQVDFNKDQVIAIADGTKPTRGYSIEINQISETNAKVIVTVMEALPPKGCILPAIPTSPYHIIKLAKTAKPVNFEVFSKPVGKSCASPSSAPF